MYPTTTTPNTPTVATLPGICPAGSALRDADVQDILLTYRQTGDPACMGELFRRYHGQVVRLCRVILGCEMQSHDIAMDIFEFLHHHLRRKQVLKFWPWLRVVCRNKCFEVQKKRQEQYVALMTIDAWLADGGALPCDTTEYWSQLKPKSALYRFIRALNPQQQTCIHLFFFEGLSYKAISKETGMSLREVKSNLQNGKKTLRRRMEHTTIFARGK